MGRELVELNGILLKVLPYSENDNLLQLLTAEKGKVIIYAKKSSKTNRNSAFNQLFAYSKFELISRGHGMMVYSGSQTIESFPELRLNPYAMAAGEYLCEVSTFVPENIDNPQEYLSLLLNSLYLLTERKVKNLNYKTIKLVFEIAFLQLSGLMPNAGECSACGNEPVYWNFDEGFLCERCASKYPNSSLYILDKSMISAINHIMYIRGVKRYAFTMNPSSFNALSRLSEEYIKYILETDLKTLNVYRQLVSREYNNEQSNKT